jgi:ATP-dependent RNA circularization protein (DNA/RNA ligase family)
MKTQKPLGIKNYGSIPHLPNSRIGLGDHHCHDGQDKIATIKTRDKNDEIIVTEKLDGSNVGIARVDDRIFALSRSGYSADTSPYEQHHHFHKWVMQQKDRWLSILNNGERLVGEWLMQAHSTRYDLNHEPFVVFDIMNGAERLPYDEFLKRTKGLTIPHLIHRGGAISVKEVMKKLGKFGFHGALDEVEGAVWRIEKKTKNGVKVDFLCKYVRPEKKDGIYLPEVSEKEPIYNWQPK